MSEYLKGNGDSPMATHMPCTAIASTNFLPCPMVQLRMLNHTQPTGSSVSIRVILKKCRKTATEGITPMNVSHRCKKTTRMVTEFAVKCAILTL